MTRSKIQKMKFFIFLLIFLLAQTAVCDGNFREKGDTPTVGGNKTTPLENKSIDVKNDKQPSTAPLSAHKNGQQNSIGLSNANKPPADSNETHDDITLKSSDVANNTTHIANTSNEVCVLCCYNILLYR